MYVYIYIYITTFCLVDLYIEGIKERFLFLQRQIVAWIGIVAYATPGCAPS